MSLRFPDFTATFHTSVYPAIDVTNASLSARGKTVVVTGGSRGIGKAIAASFASAGASAIVLLGRSAATLDHALAEVSAAAKDAGNGDATTRSLVADVCDEAAVASAFRTVRREIGPVDVLVHSAADLHMGTIEESAISEYWRCFEANVKGTLTVMQAFLRFGLDEGSPGPPNFINVLTIGIAMPSRPRWSLYGSSKLAAWRMVEHLDQEVGARARVFSIHPGRVETDMSKKAGIPTPDSKDLPGAFCVWLVATSEADFLRGRLVASNWDVEELLQRKDEIIEKGLLSMALTGVNMP